MNRFLVLALLLGTLGAGPADAQIEWRVSVKFFLDDQGFAPDPAGEFSTPSKVTALFDLANEILAGTGRGYQFRITEFVYITNRDDLWNLDFVANYTLFRDTVYDDPAYYKLRDDAINIYVFHVQQSGYCNRTSDRPVIGIGQALAKDTTPFHECGHFFGLCHTHGCIGGSSGTNQPGNDEIADTLPDNSNWSQDEIADFTFGAPFASLDPADRERVLDVWNNLMSYHGSANDRLTPDQLDHLTDVSNDPFRSFAASGVTWFVHSAQASGLGAGTLSNPYLLAQHGVAASDPGDIVLLVGGPYPESFTIDKPVTLRASRGPVRIGAP